MTTEAPLPKDHPIMIAWEKYKASDQYANAFQWAQNVDHRDGSMWNAFLAGFDASYSKPLSPAPVGVTGRKFNLGDRVTKTKGSSWTGLIVGFYSTSLTPIGYAIESENEPGSVQIYPESALVGFVTEQELLDGINALASHEPAPTDTQEGVSEADEVVAYAEVLSGKIATVRIDKSRHCTEPLVRQSALTACQQEVEKADANAMAWGAELKSAKARILELEADLEVANDKVERLRKALEEIASDDEHGDYEGVVQFARAVLGGQSNG